MPSLAPPTRHRAQGRSSWQGAADYFGLQRGPRQAEESLSLSLSLYIYIYIYYIYVYNYVYIYIYTHIYIYIHPARPPPSRREPPPLTDAADPSPFGLLVFCPYCNGNALRVRRGSFTIWSKRKTLNNLKP